MSAFTPYDEIPAISKNRAIVSVRFSSSLSQTRQRPNFTKFSVHVVYRCSSTSAGVAIGYVLPVLWMTSVWYNSQALYERCEDGFRVIHVSNTEVKFDFQRMLCSKNCYFFRSQVYLPAQYIRKKDRKQANNFATKSTRQTIGVLARTQLQKDCSNMSPTLTVFLLNSF